MWKPNVTVAAVVERDGKFLFVEEIAGAGHVFNQPAGHLDPGESLVQAVVRETLEETAYTLEPSALVGVYCWRHDVKDITYLRFAFTGHVTGHDPRRALDDGILRSVWFTPAELKQQAAKHRSPLVLQCVEDYLCGKRYPLELIQTWL
jgi:8-oxo-dGTP pyrophosphatase MutT (NUDIX family)